MAKQTNSCHIHRQARNREPLDHIMLQLPFSQAGEEGKSGRHKCAYCAYERGFADGLQQAAKKIRDVIES
ncbi:MAG: hypothetical protein OXG78_07340 [Chloroflexi bacterium]|nr:hypothetical protein [Chloroflexota bacterium]